MNRPLKLNLKITLQFFGALFLTILLLLIVAGIYFIYSNSKPNSNLASIDEVRSVFNMAMLDEKRIVKVVHSYRSSQSITDDHFNAFEILAKDIPLNLLTSENYWSRGDQINQIQNDGIDLISESVNGDGINWFLTESQIKSEEVYICVWSITYHRGVANKTEIIFVVPKNNKVYFASVKY